MNAREIVPGLCKGFSLHNFAPCLSRSRQNRTTKVHINIDISNKKQIKLHIIEKIFSPSKTKQETNTKTAGRIKPGGPRRRVELKRRNRHGNGQKRPILQPVPVRQIKTYINKLQRQKTPFYSVLFVFLQAIQGTKTASNVRGTPSRAGAAAGSFPIYFFVFLFRPPLRPSALRKPDETKMFRGDSLSGGFAISGDVTTLLLVLFFSGLSFRGTSVEHWFCVFAGRSVEGCFPIMWNISWNIVSRSFSPREILPSWRSFSRMRTRACLRFTGLL